uniref:Response regulatory domain-containing protein n=1 Tax=Quercus lobata TaxID=97700 RepID=A0A7N2LMF5_QUELO
MKRKNKGKDVLADHSETASNIFPVRIMVVDSDQNSLQQNVTILQKFPQIYKVTKCDKTDQAFTWLETDGSEFDIILIGECLLAANKLKLLQIGNARDLPVLVTSADGGIDTITRTIDDGACAYLPKPIPESVLKLVWTHAYSKRKNKLAQVQKLTDDASGKKKPRLKWTGDLKKKVVESVIEAGGIEEAKPSDILERLKTKRIQDNSITREKVSSYLQKERERANKNKEGTIEGSTLKTESNQPTGSQPSVDESLDDIYNELPSLDGGVILEDSSLPSNKSFPTGMFENYIEDDDIARDNSNCLLDCDVLTMEISEMMPSHMPGYKEGTSSEHVESGYEMEEHPPMTLPHLNTTNPNQQGLNLPLPVEANTSCTGGGLLFIDGFPNNFWEGLDSDSIDIGNDIAHEHSDNLLVVDNNFSVDNYSVDDDLLMPLAYRKVNLKADSSTVIPRIMLLSLDVYVRLLPHRHGHGMVTNKVVTTADTTPV